MTLVVALGLGLLAVPLVAWLGLTVSRSPWIALSLYAASVPFGSAVRVPGLAGGLGTLSSWLGMVATAALVLQLAGGWRRSPRLDPALPVWLMLLALTLLTYLWSVAPAETLHDVMVLAALVLLYAVAVMAPAGSVERVTLQRGLVAGGVMVGLLGFVDMATGAFAAGRAGRFGVAGGGGGGEADPNITAAALILPLAVALGEVVQERRSSRWWWFAASLLIVVGLLSTASRGGALGALTVVAVLMLNLPGRRGRLRVAAIAVVVVVVGAAVVPDTTVDRLLTRRGSTGRTAIWEVAVRQCPTFCWLGSGWGTFPEVHERALLTDPAAQGNRLRLEAHNVSLRTAGSGPRSDRRSAGVQAAARPATCRPGSR